MKVDQNAMWERTSDLYSNQADDEKQCTRLGHVCDYNPRLAFKDETAKIVEKYLGGGGGPSRQWDSESISRRILDRCLII